MTKKLIIAVFIIAFIVVVVPMLAGYENLTTQKKNDNDLIRVACVGDSLTEGSDYPSELWMLLGSNYTVGIFGHGGTTISQNATPYMDEAVFQEAKDFNPDIVIIMLGTNDALPRFKIYNSTIVADYLKLISEFQALHSMPKIWIALPPPIWHNGTGLSTEFYRQTVIPTIKEVANKTGLPLINVYEAVFDHPEFFPDGVHPNSKGSGLIASAVYKALISKST